MQSISIDSNYRTFDEFNKSITLVYSKTEFAKPVLPDFKEEDFTVEPIQIAVIAALAAFITGLLIFIVKSPARTQARRKYPSSS